MSSMIYTKISDFTSEDIKYFRKEVLGMTQQAFADKIGVSQPMVSMAERDERGITSGFIAKMYRAFSDTQTTEGFWSKVKRKLGF